MADEDVHSEIEFVEVDGQQISLAELAGIPLDEIDEKRITAFPRGVFTWEIMQEKDTFPRLQAVGGKPAGVFILSCIDVHSVDPRDKADVPEGNNDKLIGKRHREAFFFSKIEDVGYLKSFLKDLGADVKGSLGQQMRATGGLRFTAAITKRKDPKDSDKIYTNIDRNKIKVLPGRSEAMPGLPGDTVAAA